MATQHVNITVSPQDIESELGLSKGTTYSAQFQGARAQYVFMASATSEPAANTLSRNRYSESDQIVFTPANGETIYAWSDTAGGRLVVNRSP